MRRNTTHKRRGKLKPRLPFARESSCFVCDEPLVWGKRLSTGQTVCYKHWFGRTYYSRRPFEAGPLAHETFAKLGIIYKSKPIKRKSPKRSRDRQTIKRNPR